MSDPTKKLVEFLIEQADDLAHDADRAENINENERAETLRELEAQYRETATALAQSQARCAELEKALDRLGSMEAFENPRVVTKHDAELLARIDFARLSRKP
jgi:hypothetical protein